MKREQRREDNVDITELVSVRLLLFCVLIPTKCCVLLEGNLFSTLMPLRNLEKVGPEMYFVPKAGNSGKGNNE